MSGHLAGNSCKTPKYLRRGNDAPPWLDALVSCNDGLYSDFNANPWYKSRPNHEDLFLDAYENHKLRRNNTNFYQDEFHLLLSQMNNYEPRIESEHFLEKLIDLSELSDMALYKNHRNDEENFGWLSSKDFSMPHIDDLLSWKICQDRKHELFMLKEQVMCDMDKEAFDKSMKIGTECLKSKSCLRQKKPRPNPNIRWKKAVVNSENQVSEKHQYEKKPDCKHFIRGHCKRGKFCEFYHDSKHNYPDDCKVFLGGLPFHITVSELCQELSEKGFTVVNKPKIYGGFSPQVCLASAHEAKSLKEKGRIMIGGMSVDVRSYEPFTRKNKEKLIDVGKRSVFLGGLCKGTTSQMIKKELQSHGLKIVNYPLIKAGFSPQVTLSTAEQALKLISMVKVQINGVMVDIRPYAGVFEKT